MARRCLEINSLVIKESPGEPVLKFIRRLTRCYIAGFDPETVILCRAVLESAVRDRYSREEKAFPQAAPGKSQMLARLRKAEDWGWISRRSFNAARDVWERGNKAVHEDPTATSAVLETVQATMAVLEDLYD